MTRIYAAVTDLPAVHQTDPNAEDLIVRASNLVTMAIADAQFDTDEAGMPLGDDLEACKNAVVIQVSTWLSTGVNPVTGYAGKPKVATSKSSNGSSVSYAVDSASEAYLNLLAEGTSLTANALVPLQVQGLLAVVVVGYQTRPRPFLRPGTPMFYGGGA
jgi:hypothetical protein